jgi:hypothetical protein
MRLANPLSLNQQGYAFNTTQQKLTPTIPKFGNAATVQDAVKVRSLLEKVDFIGKGASPAKQIAVIFGSLITWRLLAANDRRRASVSKRWNELRENLMRDLLGFGFWFLGVPVVQRVYLRTAAKYNPQLKDVLVQNLQENGKPHKGIMDLIKANNPVNNRYIPSSQQVKDQKELALKALGNISKDSKLYQQTEAVYDNLVKHRNFATAIGLGSTILLLGVGINLLNFYLTHKNMNRQGQPINPVIPSQRPFNALPTPTQPFPNVMNAYQNPFRAQAPVLPASFLRTPF